jgi:S-disulfanyl-L-cysteine oxidoreductase SoxD
MTSSMPSRRTILLGSLAVTLAVLGAAAAWVFVGRAQPLRITTDDPAVLTAGAALYAEHCAACHGRDLEGEPDWRVRGSDGTLPAPPHDASGHTWHHSDADLFAMTRHGIEPFAPAGYRSTMPAFDGILDDAEIRAILAHIKSQWPAEVRRLQERLND